MKVILGITLDAHLMSMKAAVDRIRDEECDEETEQFCRGVMFAVRKIEDVMNKSPYMIDDDDPDGHAAVLIGFLKRL